MKHLGTNINNEKKKETFKGAVKLHRQKQNVLIHIITHIITQEFEYFL